MFKDSTMDKLEELKTEVKSGKYFNGVVYGEIKPNCVRLSVYVGGKRYWIVDVEKEDSDECKKFIKNYLGLDKSKKLRTWTVNGNRTIKNYLTYGEMFHLYGTDFE